MTIQKLAILSLISFTFSACTVSDDVTPQNELSTYNEEVVDYFKEIALGFEFGNASKVTRKYEGRKMKVFVGGSPTASLRYELSKVVTEINTLTTDGFAIEIIADSSASNFYVFFGSGDNYAKMFPSQQSLVGGNWGLFSVFWNGNNSLTGGYMYVDIFRADLLAQRHLLREELTQSLGLARDSDRYPESIFQQRWTTTINYAPIDKELIRLLYHPNVKSGLLASEVETVLTSILLAEQNAI